MAPLKKYFALIALLFIWSFSAFAQTNCQDTPDPGLTDTNGGNFVQCSSALGGQNFNLEVTNSSSTKQTNVSYTIDWGDGNVENFPASFTVASHEYKTQDQFDLTFTVKSEEGCTQSKVYSVYNGTNPRFGLQNPGGSSGCVGSTFTFAITGTDKNSPNTTYKIWFDDGSEPLFFTQQNLPSHITKTFDEGSTGKPDGFTMFGEAIDCKVSPASVGGIRISVPPNAAFKVDPGQTVCTNADVTLIDESTGGYNGDNPANSDAYRRIWSISPAGGWRYESGSSSSSDKPVVIFTKSGKYEITLTVKPLGSNPSCSEDVTRQTITVEDPTQASFELLTSGANECAPSRVGTQNLTPGNNISYAWSVLPAEGVTISDSTSAFEPGILFSIAGVYTVTLKATNGCGTTEDTKNITIKDLPTVTLPPAISYCGPQTISFSTDNLAHAPAYNASESQITRYQWTVSGPDGVQFIEPAMAASANPTLSFSQPGEYQIQVMTWNSCGVSAAATQTITIQALPENPVIEPLLICAGETATLLATGNGASFQWFSTATSTQVLSTTASFTTPALNNTTSYFVEAISENGCTSAARTEVIVTVQPLPLAPAISNVTICSGEKALLQTTVADARIEWYTTIAGGEPFYQGNQLDSLFAVSTTLYVGSISNTGNCRSADRTKVVVTVEPPIANNTLSIASYGICLGSNTKEITASLPTGGSGAATYQWQKSLDGELFEDIVGQTARTLPSMPLLETTWFRRIVKLGACTQPTPAIKVAAVPPITNNVLAVQPEPICAGTIPSPITSEPLIGGDNTNPTYVWLSSSTKNGTYKAASGSGTLLTFQPDALTQNQWFRRVVTVNGCESISESVEIKVNPLSLPPTAAGKTICSGSQAILTATAPSGPYTWYATETGGVVLFTGNSFTTEVLTNHTDGPVTFTYYVQSEATGGCTVRRTAVQVVVEPAIANNTIQETPQICAGSTAATVAGSSPTGGSGSPRYVWEFTTDAPQGDGNEQTFRLATNASKNSQHYEPGTLTVITWVRRKVTLGTCVEYSNVVKIDVTPALANNKLPAATEFCEGTEVPLLEETPGVSVTGGNPDTGIQYKWYISINGPTSGFEEAPGLNTEKTYQPVNLTAPNTWFQRMAISESCTLPSNAIKVTLIPRPAIPVASKSVVTFCQGAAATAEVRVVAGLSYNWYNEAGTLIGSGATLSIPSTSIMEAKTYAFYVEAKSGKGCFASERTQVNVLVLPALSETIAVGAQTVCYGSAPTSPLTANVPTGGNERYSYRWELTTDLSKPFQPTGSGDTLQSYSPGPLTKTTYFRRAVISGECMDYSSMVKVTVDAPLVNTIALTGGNGEVCYGLAPSIVLGGNASGGDGILYRYQWEYRTSPSQPYQITSTADTLASLKPSALYVDTYFRRVVRSGACVLESNVIYLHVNPIPAAPMAQGTTTCAGSTASLTATGDGVIQWLDAQGKLLYQGSSGSIFRTPVLTATTTFLVKVLSDAQCASPATAVVVTVEQKVTNNTVAAVAPVCFETAPALLVGSQPQNGNSVYTYQWYIRTKSKNYEPIQNATSANHQHGLLTQTVWFKRGVTSGTCAEELSTEVEVTVNMPVAAGSNYIKAAQFIPANTAPRELIGSTISGGNTYTYQWFYKTNDLASFEAIGGATALHYQPGVLSKTTQYRRQVIFSGCFDFSDPVTITVVNGFADNAISGGGQVCYNEPANLMLTGNHPTENAQEVTYFWESKTKNRDFITLTTPSAREKDYMVPTLTETTIFRRRAVMHGLTTFSGEVEVVVLVPITYNHITTPPQTVCIGSAPVTLVGTIPKGGTGSNYLYLWESSDNATSGFKTAVGIATAKDYAPSALLRDTWFRRRVVSGNCLSEPSEAVKVTTNALPKAPTAQNVFACAGTSAILKAISDGTKLEWYDQAQGGKLLETGATFATPILQMSTTYYVQTVALGCASERVAVTVEIPLPTAYAGPDQTIDFGKRAELRATGGVSYKWSPAASLNNASLADPVATPKETTTYTVTVTTADGCTSTDQVTITMLPAVVIPNGFTPNGDGVNDTWNLLELKNYPDCNVQIFNRWGNKVFESRGYQNEWDGTLNGTPLPSATYYYIIKLNGNEKPLSGNVTIIK